MKSIFWALLGASLSFSSFVHAQAAGSGELDSREARIRRNLEKGAFNINGGIFSNNTVKLPDELRLRDKSETEVRRRLDEMGINYLFLLDHRDLNQDDKMPFYSIPDFMGNATAQSKGGTKFRAQNCALKRETGERDNRFRNTQAEKDFPAATTESESFARFDRLSPADAVGGYLLVQEADPAVTNLSPYEGFTVGTWMKLKSDPNGKNADGYFPILSKSSLNQANAQGKFEWEFKTTGNVVYLIINRGGFSQNINFGMPWWGDHFGSCYEGGIHRECWHYISVSFDPSINKVSVFFMRKFANYIPEPAAEYFHRGETSARENSMPIQSSRQTALRIGGSNSNTMDGVLKGVFFARKALAAEEMKAMGLLTAPNREALNCTIND